MILSLFHEMIIKKSWLASRNKVASIWRGLCKALRNNITYLASSGLYQVLPASRWNNLKVVGNYIFVTHKTSFQGNYSSKATRSRWRHKRLSTEDSPVIQHLAKGSSHKCGDMVFNLFNCHVTSRWSRNQRVMWLYGFEDLALSQQLAKFAVHWSSTSGDT